MWCPNCDNLKGQSITDLALIYAVVLPFKQLFTNDLDSWLPKAALIWLIELYGIEIYALASSDWASFRINGFSLCLIDFFFLF